MGNKEQAPSKLFSQATVVDNFGSFFSGKVKSIVHGLKALSLNLPTESTTTTTTCSDEELLSESLFSL